MEEHFALAGATITPLSAEGRVTAFILQFNHPDRLQERERLIAIGQYPWNRHSTMTEPLAKNIGGVNRLADFSRMGEEHASKEPVHPEFLKRDDQVIVLEFGSCYLFSP